MISSDFHPNKGKIRFYKKNDKVMWLFKVEFKEIDIRGDKRIPNLGMGDLEMGIKNPRDLVSKKLSWDRKYFNEGHDASFYIYEHDYLNFLEIEFLKVEKEKVLAKIKCSIDYKGVSSDSNPNLELEFKVWLEIEVSGKLTSEDKN